MKQMSREEAQSWLLRWQLVRDAEIAELRSTSMTTKLQQLSALMGSRDLFGAEHEQDEEAEQVRQRWARLRRNLSV